MNRSRLDMNTASASTPTTAATWRALGPAAVAVAPGPTGRLLLSTRDPPSESGIWMYYNLRSISESRNRTKEVSCDRGCCFIEAFSRAFIEGRAADLLHRPCPGRRRREVGPAGGARGLPRRSPVRRDDPPHRGAA